MTYPERTDRFGDLTVPYHVVAVGRLLNPKRFVLRELFHVLNCLGNIPLLVGVHHEEVVIANPCEASGASAQNIDVKRFVFDRSYLSTVYQLRTVGSFGYDALFSNCSSPHHIILGIL